MIFFSNVIARGRNMLRVCVVVVAIRLVVVGLSALKQWINVIIRIFLSRVSMQCMQSTILFQKE